MRHHFHYLFVFTLFMVFTGCSGKAQTPKSTPAAGPNRIDVLDFHTTHRCRTCLTIEQLTKEVLAESYPGEIEKGLIAFRLINADEEANEAIVKKYLAFGTTLVISTVSNGQETSVDLTDFAFMNADNATKFKAGLKERLEASLQKVRP